MVLEQRNRSLGSLDYLILILALSFSAQGQPILRNSFSTNTPGNPVLGSNNISLTNITTENQDWKFYGQEATTVPNLRDLVRIKNQANIPTWDSTNVQWRLVKNLTLTNVTDCSSAAWYPSNQTFFVIHNAGNGVITEWTPDGICRRAMTNPVAGKVPDCEGICWMGGNRFAVVDEDYNRFFIVTITNETTGWITNNTTIIQASASIGTDLGSGAGIEGLAWDEDRNGWWIVREKLPAQLMFLSADGQVTNNWFTTAQMQTFTNSTHTDFSDIHFDRHNQMLWVTQDEPNQYDRVIGISLRTSNVVVTLNCTNFGQLEGVSLTDDGKLITVGEVNQYALWEATLGGLNSGISWAQPATNAASIPSFPGGIAGALIVSNTVASSTTNVSTTVTTNTGLQGVYNLAGFEIPFWKTDDQNLFVTEPALFLHDRHSCQPGQAQPSLMGAGPLVAAGTFYQIGTLAGTAAEYWGYNNGYHTTATSNNTASINLQGMICAAGTVSPGYNGYLLAMRFGVTNGVIEKGGGGINFFAGVMVGGGAPASVVQETNGAVERMGLQVFGQMGSTNFFWISRDTAGNETRHDTTIALYPSNTYLMHMYCPPRGRTVGWRLQNLHRGFYSNAFETATISTNVHEPLIAICNETNIAHAFYFNWIHVLNSLGF